MRKRRPAAPFGVRAGLVTEPAGGLRSPVPLVRDRQVCNDQHYEKPEGRWLWIVCLLPCRSAKWKAEYKKRPVIKRHFSSAKYSWLLDTHRHLNIGKVSLNVAMSTLAHLATARAHLKADDYPRMRHMRIRLPQAQGASRTGQISPPPACRDLGCGCCIRWREVA